MGERGNVRRGICLLLLAWSLPVACLSIDAPAPQQVHLAQGKDPSSMVVSWVTAGHGPDVVMYGKSPEAVDKQAVGNDTVVYSFQDKRFPPYTSGFLHHVTLTGLEPATRYYYQIGAAHENQDGPTPLFHFDTLPAVGSRSRMVFAVVADLGQTLDSVSTVNHMLQDTDAQMLLHAGDGGYADCEQVRWDSFMTMMSPLSSTLPWMISPGNHEIEYSRGAIFQAFENRFRMPWVAPPLKGEAPYPGHHDPERDCTPSVYQAAYDYGNAYFSFDAGMAHIIFLNSYSYTNATSRQYQWLESDLKAVDRSHQPWILVIMHCPWYNSDQAHFEESHTTSMKAAMETLLHTYKVNAVMSGHVHAYERSHPVYNGQPSSDGVVYFNIGDAGNREGHASTYYDPAPAWSAFRNGTQYGHATLVLEDEEKLTWQWHRNVDGEFVVRDSMSVCNVARGWHADCSAKINQGTNTSTATQKDWTAGWSLDTTQQLLRTQRRAP